MEDGLGKIKKVVKRVGDTASEFETKAEPFLDWMLGLITKSRYSGRIILSLVLAAFAAGWWAGS